jgi:hypothetical protein
MEMESWAGKYHHNSVTAVVPAQPLSSPETLGVGGRPCDVRAECTGPGHTDLNSANTVSRRNPKP